MSMLHELLHILKYPSKEKIDQVTRAYEFVKGLYGGQNLFSNGSYFKHLVGTAKVLAGIGMGRDTISAGLLHNILRNKTVSREKLKNEFGDNVTLLVEDIAKVERIPFPDKTRHTESFAKLLFTTAPDLRVLIVKLAERLDTVRNAHELSPAEKSRVAREILTFYVPLAECLGILRIKQELETRAFQITNPKDYRYVSDLIRVREAQERKGLENFKKSLLKSIIIENILVLKSEIRVKSPYSIYRKLRIKGSANRIYDIRALRVIVPSVADCYRVLGIIHTHWTPLPHRIKDYIALPKPDGYQSLHTTIFVGNGSIIEIQIRTPEMHDRAQWGVVSHTYYKPAERNPIHKFFKLFFPSATKIDAQDNERRKKISEFLNGRMFVFNKRGEVIDLPKDATVVDFAFLLETDKAPRLAGARVNGIFAPINTKLKNGDVVELHTKKNAKPRPKWMRYAATTGARDEINKYLKNEPAAFPPYSII